MTYTNTFQGKTYTETDALVREDGSWKAERTVKRTPDGRRPVGLTSTL